MKNVNLNQLRLVIREALMEEQEEEAPGAEAAPGGDAKALDSAGGGKEKSDVAKVLAYIQKIDNRGELAQVLMGVIQHAGNVSGSKAVLLKLYKQLPGMIKQMQESKLNEDEGLPKRKPKHADYEEGHTDGFEGKPKKKDRSKDYNEGFKDGKASDKEYKDVTKECKDVTLMNLREALVKESLKRSLKNAIKK